MLSVKATVIPIFSLEKFILNSKKDNDFLFVLEYKSLGLIKLFLSTFYFLEKGYFGSIADFCSLVLTFCIMGIFLLICHVRSQEQKA